VGAGENVTLQDGKRTVLVVDDEVAMRDSCTQVLERQGYCVATAVDGDECLDLVRKTEPDVAILDLKMPGLSDMDLLHTFRSRHPNVVAVVITGYATLNSAVEAMKAGAYDFLPKPFTPDELRMVVNRAMERRDLERKSAALEQDKRLMQDNFAAMVSHQLRSPLAAAAECMETVKTGMTGPLTEKQQSMVDRASRRIDDLLLVIEDWLTLSRIETEGVESMGAVDLKDTLKTVCEKVTADSCRKDVRFEMQMAKEQILVHGDDGLLREVFGNLFNNAMKYTPDEGLITIEMTREGDDAVVSVADTGIGIPEEELPFIFEPFFRGGSQHAKSVGGTGLGLPIVRNIVEAHGGLISVISAVNEGTTFLLRLPLERGIAN
jgi:two-component system sensor histidine kinase/response regulator